MIALRVPLRCDHGQMRPLPAARQTRAPQCPAEPRRLRHRRHLRGRIPGHRPVLPACHRRLATRTTALERRDVDAENAGRQAPIHACRRRRPSTRPPSSHRTGNARASRLASNATASSHWSHGSAGYPSYATRPRSSPTASPTGHPPPQGADHPAPETAVRAVRATRHGWSSTRSANSPTSTEPGPGQPEWAALMARKRRKTLVVCHPCHDAIHTHPPPPRRRSLESRMLGNGPVRFGGGPHGKGPAQRAPRRAATQFTPWSVRDEKPWRRRVFR